MGNGVGKLSLCFAGDAGAISRRRNDIAVYLSDPLDEGYGHSFCYFHHDSSRLSAADSITPAAASTFKSISGASLSANTSTPLSTAPIDLRPQDAASFDKPSSFASSDSFAAIPLQPIPRNSIPSVHSGPILGTPGAVSSSGPIGRGFLSGPIQRSFISGPLENQYDHLQRYKPKSKKLDLIKNIKKAITNSIVLPIRGVGSAKDSDWAYGLEKNNENCTVTTVSSQASLADDSEEPFENPNIQWAQGKSGEDRVHIVISEEHGWVFVGIYDGFNGPDATDYLLNNLYSNVQKELRGLLWNDNSEESAPTNFPKTEHVSRNSASVGVNHSEVLKALSEGLKKTEDSFLDISDFMLMENPELSLMGSCVLVMLMKGEDVYLMNVGDSRAVLARKDEPDLGVGKLSQELERINEENSNGDEFDSLSNLTSLQLTVDHNTSTEEEVKKIKKEHPDDASAIANDRVKGSLKVTRAFGAGFLKQPKWNNALLEMFRIDYMGSSPYISCSPSLYHHRIGPRDRFLVLSSDGLYQYFTNEEAICQIESFVSSFPEGDPAQHLVEQVLFRAAKKAGMDFHELLDIPQGDRRRYHDDVSIIIISFEGRLWRSSSV